MNSKPAATVDQVAVQHLKPSFGHENALREVSTERVVCRFKLLIAISVILLACLSAMSLLAGRQGYKNLLLATPSGFGGQGLNTEKLEELSEEEFLLTYAVRQTAAAQAIHSKHTVTLAGTNQNYADVMGYIMLDGGFFTKGAWDAENKQAVLNETAAFKIFGSNRITGQTLKLNGEPWIVTGVIDDGDGENANIYAPSSVTGGQVDSLMALMDGKTVSEAYVKNALKGVGIHEDNYDFINLSKSASAFDERFAVAWKLALLAVIILLVRRTGGGIMQSLRFYRSRLREIYFKELFAHHGAQLVKTAAGLLLLTGGIAAALLLSLGILEACLALHELEPVTGEQAAGDFGAKLAWLRDFQWIDVSVFAVYIGTVLFNTIFGFRAKRERAGAGICRRQY